MFRKLNKIIKLYLVYIRGLTVLVIIGEVDRQRNRLYILSIIFIDQKWCSTAFRVGIRQKFSCFIS